MQLLSKWSAAEALLADWESRPFAKGSAEGPGPADHRDSFEQPAGAQPPGAPLPDSLHRRIAEEIMAYRVFPSNWIVPVLRRTPLQLGDTVGARFRRFPLVDCFFASRVTSIFDGEAAGIWRSGFTYRTLAGHPELGEETFSVETDLATGAVTIAMRSWSRPGLILTRLGQPLLRRVQVSANRAALAKLHALE